MNISGNLSILLVFLWQLSQSSVFSGLNWVFSMPLNIGHLETSFNCHPGNILCFPLMFDPLFPRSCLFLFLDLDVAHPWSLFGCSTAPVVFWQRISKTSFLELLHLWKCFCSPCSWLIISLEQNCKLGITCRVCSFSFYLLLGNLIPFQFLTFYGLPISSLTPFFLKT